MERKQTIATDVRQVNTRAFDFTISTEEPDRDGDVVEVAGWDLSAYKRNPVVLWAHSHSEPPIGRAKRVFADGKRLRAEVEFPPDGLSPFADQIRALVEAKFLRATSVGFLPKEWEPLEGGKGRRFKRQELLEFSIVPVPSNAGALAAAFGQKAAARYLAFAADELEIDLEDGEELHLSAAEWRTVESRVSSWARQAVRDGLRERLVRLGLTGDPEEVPDEWVPAISGAISGEVRRALRERIRELTGRLL